MPISASASLTRRWISLGCVLPHPSLMFIPFGSLCATATSAPSSRKMHGVDLTRKNELLDLFFDLVIKFVAVVPEKFDAVVFVRIVRSRKNNAGVCTQRSGNVCHARRWQRTDDKNIDAK